MIPSLMGMRLEHGPDSRAAWLADALATTAKQHNH
jgi:hypothetical protein